MPPTRRRRAPRSGRARPFGALLLALVAAPLGCAPVEEPAAEDTAPVVDDDNDGWPLPQDCDDALPGIHPGAAERCNGSDDDCDGVVDDHAEDGTVGWLDMDGDGWGDSATRDLFCTDFGDDRPFATLEGDCDDGDARVHPFGFETCANPADEDCDGTANDAAAFGCAPFFLDLDGDGVGTETSTCLCEAEGSWRGSAAGDCDDEDPAVSAGCALTGARTVADADTVIAGDTERDGAGGDLAYAGDPDGDGWPDLLVASTDSRRSSGWWLLRGPFGTSADVVAADAVYTDPLATNPLAARVAGGQDLDGDGVDDVALGVYGTGPGTDGRPRGLVYVVSGGASGDVPLEWADASIETPVATSTFTLQVAASPDTDGDGVGELFVGGTDGANAWLFAGPVTGELAVADARLTLTGTSTNLGAGLAAPGDLDGDGLGDLLLGASSTDGRGAAWVVAGGSSGFLGAADATAILVAPNGAQGVGRDVAGAGDVDGDGHADVLVAGDAAPGGATRTGTVWLVRGPVAGSTSLADAWARIDGLNAVDEASVVTGAGDLDGDGFSDIAVGARGADLAGTDAGAVYGFLGPVAGTLRVHEADLRVYGLAASDAVGAAVAGGFDLDLDGYSDLLFGAPGADVGGTTSGAAYVVRGGAR
ncbi:MAG: MopE-related protein [Myxococcota bacterium]